MCQGIETNKIVTVDKFEQVKALKGICPILSLITIM